MRKTIKLGKIDYCGIGRKTCPVEVMVELRELEGKGPELAVSGTIWNHRHTGIYSSGQNLDVIAGYVKTPEFREIHRLWLLHHLNSMHAGTEAQEKALDKAGLTGYASRYDECCRYLESVGLLYDGGYKFGSGWLYRAIPEEDLKKIKKLIYDN